VADEFHYALTLVRIFVTDFERAVRFYTETLEMPLTLRDDELGWAQLDTGAAQLALERLDPSVGEQDAALVGRFLALSLAVRDIDTIHERLVGRGVEFVGAPELMPWGGVLAHFYDPDRNVLTLVGPPLGSLRLG
jgi:predicted enzyme related to lactoylglutathione lyase